MEISGSSINMPVYGKVGGTWEQFTGCFVKVGGSWESVPTISIQDGGWQTISFSVAFNITVATDTDTIGYSNNSQLGVFGTLNSVSGLPPTASIGAIYQLNSGSVHETGFMLIIGADPGQSSLTSITANSITFTGSSASAYSYTNGMAQWTWSPGINTWSFTSGSTYPGTIIPASTW